MTQLKNTTQVEINALIDKSMKVYSPDDISETISTLEKAWALLPAPKEKWQDGFLIVKYMVHSYFNVKNFEKAEEWSSLFRSFNGIRDYGESEFMSGKIAFERNKLDIARDYFETAEKKSDGRVWKGERDLKYYKFFKAKKK